MHDDSKLASDAIIAEQYHGTILSRSERDVVQRCFFFFFWLLGESFFPAGCSPCAEVDRSFDPSQATHNAGLDDAGQRSSTRGCYPRAGRSHSPIPDTSRYQPVDDGLQDFFSPVGTLLLEPYVDIKDSSRADPLGSILTPLSIIGYHHR